MVSLFLEAAQPLRAARAVARLERHASGSAPLLSEAREGDSAGPNRQLVVLIRSRDPDGSLRPKHNRSPSSAAACNPMQKNPEGPLRKSLFRHSLPNRAPSTDFSLSATPFHFFSHIELSYVHTRVSRVRELGALTCCGAQSRIQTPIKRAP